MADYLQTYVTALGLPVRLNAQVTSLTGTDHGFGVRTADDTFQARQVVVATGPFQVPFVPPAAQGLEPSVTQVHSASYRNAQALPGGAVLVVGGGNSGSQIAEELVTGSNPVSPTKKALVGELFASLRACLALGSVDLSAKSCGPIAGSSEQLIPPL